MMIDNNFIINSSIYLQLFLQTVIKYNVKKYYIMNYKLQKKMTKTFFKLAITQFHSVMRRQHHSSHLKQRKKGRQWQAESWHVFWCVVKGQGAAPGAGVRVSRK